MDTEQVLTKVRDLANAMTKIHELAALLSAEQRTAASALAGLLIAVFEQPQAPAEPKAPADKPKTDAKVLGLTLGELTAKQRAEFKIADAVKGVLITAVEADSVAADKHIEPGDVIVEVAQQVVAKPEDVTSIVAKQKDQGRRSALLLIADPTGALRFDALKID